MLWHDACWQNDKSLMSRTHSMTCTRTHWTHQDNTVVLWLTLQHMAFQRHPRAATMNHTNIPTSIMCWHHHASHSSQSTPQHHNRRHECMSVITQWLATTHEQPTQQHTQWTASYQHIIQSTLTPFINIPRHNLECSINNNNNMITPH